jgi:hypothetical protein
LLSYNAQQENMLEQERMRREIAAAQQRERDLQMATQGADPAQAARMRLNPSAYFKPLEPSVPDTWVEMPDGTQQFVPAQVVPELLAAGGKKLKGSPLVQIGTDKPLGADANKFVGPDGSSPPPTMSTVDAVAAGYRLKTEARQKAESRQGTISADLEFLESEIVRTRKNYKAAEEAFNANRTAETKRAFDNAAAEYRTAVAGRSNWRGEPSEGVAERFKVPGAFGRAVEGVANRIIGAPEEPDSVNWEDL